ncbi:DUF1963 domain-containing protein [Actinomadura harenae]|uniref:DUF1963 domain-containing protein n=1 Tax=Actinomadura harenae TaxID=2483351 RepID=A0A3M2LSP7_9ACTN|nr:DUF1963 domain-containing protein [Actinomadura harenae]RMI40499.1 DUF1963 domain-containing protein [Actinomadura harenae]
MGFASYEEASAQVRDLCVEHLGEHLGAQVAALAKPAFGLRPVKPGTEPAGLSRWGGPALLNPGTPWPECEGVPLSLLAVLDVDALGPWLAAERPPTGDQLLNIFYCEPDPGRGYVYGQPDLPRSDDPRMCRIIPADPAKATETDAPAPALIHPPQPFYAVPVITLPSAFSVDYDPTLDTLDYNGETDGSPYYESMPGWLVADRLGEAWAEFCHKEQGLYKYDDMSFSPDQAFGWPHLEGHFPLEELSEDEPYRHVITIGHGMGDGSYLHFVLPAQALRTGDYTQTRAFPESF